DNLTTTNSTTTNGTSTAFAISSIAHGILSTNANGSVVASTSIGTNYLTGALGTINGTTLTAAGSITVTAASSTLLANNNTWTGTNTFGTLSMTNGSSTAFAITSIPNAILSTNANGSVIAT